MMAERGVSLAHTTIMRWIARYVLEFEKRWNRFACRARASLGGTFFGGKITPILPPHCAKATLQRNHLTCRPARRFVDDRAGLLVIIGQLQLCQRFGGALARC